MPKKIPITILFTVVTAVVALFAATQVRAQYPGSFDQTNYEWFEYNGFRVEIVKPFPSYDIINDKSTFTWAVTKLPSAQHNPSHVEVLIERIFNGLIIEAKVNGVQLSNTALVCNGSGDPSSEFGKYLTYNCLYKWTPLPSPPLQVSLTIQGKLSSAPSDFFVKVANCSFDPNGVNCPESAWGPIQAPALPCISTLGPYSPSVTSDVRTIKNVQIKILRDPDTGCGYALQYSTDGGTTWPTVNPTDPPIIDGEPVVDCGGTTAKAGCLQECIVTAAASPGWSYQFVGGAWYKVCIGYLWNATTCCKNPPNAGLPCQ